MIDNVTITLTDFSGNFENCVKKKKPLIKSLESDENVEKPDEYRLKNNSNSKKLKILQSKKTEKVFIQGSIRQWYMHKGCLHDLTYQMFVDAMNDLAEKLNISFDEICNGRVTRCEIGQSLSTKYSIPEIINSLALHGQLKINKEHRYDTTIYFKNDGGERIKQLKVYDKTKESADKGTSKHKKVAEFLKSKGISVLRIEVTLYNKKSFKGEKILKNALDVRPEREILVGDIILNYPALYEYWANEINRFVVFSAIDENEKMSKSERAMAKKLNELGADKSLEDFLEGVKESYTPEMYKNKSTLNNVRHKKREEYLDVISKYHSTETYRKNLLKMEVTKHLKRKNKQNENFPYSEILKILWNPNKTTKK